MNSRKHRTPLGNVRDLYMKGVLQPRLDAGDELVGWTPTDYRSSDGTVWSRLPVVRTRDGALQILLPLAFRLPAQREDGVGHA